MGDRRPRDRQERPRSTGIRRWDMIKKIFNCFREEVLPAAPQQPRTATEGAPVPVQDLGRRDFHPRRNGCRKSRL